MLPHFYQSVPGWFGFQKQYEDVAENAKSGDVIVELGSFHGRSAAFLAIELANRGKDCRLVCVDTFCGSGVSLKEQEYYKEVGKTENWLSNFKEQMQRGGVLDRIEILVEDSASAARHFADGSVRYVLIDAAHTYVNVRRDIQAWLPKLQSGGILMGDDYHENQWPEVVIAARDTLPLARIEEWPGASFRYVNKQRDVGVWATEPPATFDEFCFIPYVNGPDFLQKAIESIRSVWPLIIVIDQSPSGLGDRPWLNGVFVYRAQREKQTCCQMFNWVRYEAWRRGAHTIFYMHHDAELLNPLLFDAMRGALNADPKCGIVFTNFDIFSAFRVEAWIDTGAWDETFPWYFCDADYYTRMNLRGWKTVNCGSADSVRHYGSATWRTDPKIQREVKEAESWTENHYRHKWGGKWGKEKYTTPYNGDPNVVQRRCRRRDR